MMFWIYWAAIVIVGGLTGAAMEIRGVKNLKLYYTLGFAQATALAILLISYK